MTHSVNPTVRSLMTVSCHRVVLVLLLAAMMVTGLSAALPLQAQETSDPNNLVDERNRSQEVRTRISRRQASELAQKNFSGRVLSVRLDGSRWRVRMDEDGKVFNVFVDAQTGKVSRAE